MLKTSLDRFIKKTMPKRYRLVVKTRLPTIRKPDTMSGFRRPFEYRTTRQPDTNSSSEHWIGPVFGYWLYLATLGTVNAQYPETFAIRMNLSSDIERSTILFLSFDIWSIVQINGCLARTFYYKENIFYDPFLYKTV
jgi:hypothetical protein